MLVEERGNEDWFYYCFKIVKCDFLYVSEDTFSQHQNDSSPGDTRKVVFRYTMLNRLCTWFWSYEHRHWVRTRRPKKCWPARTLNCLQKPTASCHQFDCPKQKKKVLTKIRSHKTFCWDRNTTRIQI